jgi:rubrerythrin
MQVSNFLRAAARVEFQAEELYSAMAEAFFHTAALRDTFRRLAAEERQHAMRLRLLERHLPALPWSAAETARRTSELAEMSGALAGLRQELHSASGSRDPYAMLRKLADLEGRFAGAHAEQIAPDADPSVRRLFASMAQQDAEHGRLIGWLASSAAA